MQSLNDSLETQEEKAATVRARDYLTARPHYHDKHEGDLGPCPINSETDEVIRRWKGVDDQPSVSISQIRYENLLDASIQGNLGRVEQLIKNGADIDWRCEVNGNNALMTSRCC